MEGTLGLGVLGETLSGSDVEDVNHQTPLFLVWLPMAMLPVQRQWLRTELLRTLGGSFRKTMPARWRGILGNVARLKARNLSVELVQVSSLGRPGLRSSDGRKTDRICCCGSQKYSEL